MKVRALRDFSSPIYGNIAQGDEFVIHAGDEWRADHWIDLGQIEKVGGTKAKAKKGKAK